MELQNRKCMKPKKNAALIFIFITLLLDVIGLGIIAPVMPNLIMELTGEGISTSAQYGGWLIIAYALPQFLFAPVIGGLSDQFGRRPVLLASLFGFGIDYLFLGFAPTISWLFVGRLVSGITGASYATATAYIADVSTPEKRAQNFGLVGAAFGLGFIVGPTLGGLLGQYGTRVPFFVSAGLTLLNWLYGYFILPESLSKENRRKFDIKRANPVGALIQFKKYPMILGLVASLVLIYLASHATHSTWSFYTMEKFSWDEAMVGYSLGFVGLMVALVQGGLVRVAIPKLGHKKALIVGLMFSAFGFALFGLANQGWMMFAIMVPFALGGIAGPALQGIISNQVPDNAQGEIQGSLTSLASLTSIFGPLLMTTLFAQYSAPEAAVYFPGAPFMMGAVLTAVSVFLCIRSLAEYKQPEAAAKEPVV